MKFRAMTIAILLCAAPMVYATGSSKGTYADADAHANSSANSSSLAKGGNSIAVSKGGDATSIAAGGKGGEASSNATAKGGKGGNAKVGDTTSTASNTVGNVSSASGDSNSTSTVGNVSSYSGDSTSHASANVGDTSATVGDTSATIGDVTTGASTSSAVSTNEGNNVASENTNTVNDGDINIDAGSVYESNYEAAASSAASVFAGYCQSGGSGQLTGGGFSVVNSEQFCDHVRLASIMREAYEYEVAMGNSEGQFATKYYEAYHDNLGDALSLIEGSEFAGMIDRNTGFIIRPAALIGLLIFLL